MIYRTNHEWRSAYGGQLACAKPGEELCPSGFARQLVYGTSGVVYRDNAPDRGIQRSKQRHSTPEAFTPKGAMLQREHNAKRPRWTEEQEQALPKTYHQLTRISGSEHVERPHATRVTVHEYRVRFRCLCGAESSIPRTEWAGPSCPRACRKCRATNRKAAA